MVFKRRDRRPFWRILVEFLWPRGGWARAAMYVRHRLQRLPDPPERIARGIFAGVVSTFTPFYGFHFLTAIVIALVMRGNLLAAMLATFFGNPLTYVPIGVISMRMGYWLLGLDGSERHGSLGHKFSKAAGDLWQNFKAIFTPERADWDGLAVFYREVFFPYMVGGIIPGIVAGLVAYYLSLPLIRAYQNRRKGVLQGKLRGLKKKAADVANRGE